MKKLFSRLFNYPAHPMAVGVVGLASTQTAFAMNSDQINTIAEAAQTTGDPTTIIIQIIIGIATLIKLFKKNNNESTGK